MLDALGRHETDIVVAHTLDRWARKLSVQCEAIGILDNAGGGFSSVIENTGMFTPSGRLMLNTMGSIYELFPDQPGLHVRKSLKFRAESGLHNGPLPVGYSVLAAGGVPQITEKPVMPF